MSKTRERRLAAGATLIVIGLGLYLLRRFDDLEGSVLFLLLGAAFLTAYLVRRIYGLLVPAGVLLGLGVGTALEDTFHSTVNTVPLGLGCGFLAIYLISRLYEGRGHWWPLIPGTVLVLAGIPRTERLLDYLTDNWPLILVIVGVLVILGGLRARSDEPAGREESSPPGDSQSGGGGGPSGGDDGSGSSATA